MKNLLKKLNVSSNQADSDESPTSKGKKMILGSSPRSQSQSDHGKPFSALAGWFHSVTNRKSPSPPSSSKPNKGEKIEHSDSTSSEGLEAALLDAGICASENSITKGPDIDEEYQIQLAMELSAKEDPEAVQIEAVKQISLGSSYHSESDPAEVVAYRYWNYSALSYDDKIVDGFYDIYGVVTESNSSKMPSLVDLQGVPTSQDVSWEVILVNKHADTNLLKLLQRGLVLANNVPASIELIQEVARLVANYMGGPVEDPGSMLRAWKSLSYSLKSTLGSMVLPLGSLTIGLARHRALLFKVLADSVSIPCQLVKGQLYTGSDEVAINVVKIDDDREFIVDLMADPGALIPFDGLGTHVEYEESFASPVPLSREADSSIGTSNSGAINSSEEPLASEAVDYENRSKRHPGAGDDGQMDLLSSVHRLGHDSEDSKSDMLYSDPPKMDRLLAEEFPKKAPVSHFRSPSWTEGVTHPAMQKMKVNEVSVVINAAKGNPLFAKKLHDALLETGVVAPPNFYTGMHPTPFINKHEPKHENNHESESSEHHHQEPMHPHFLPPLPPRGGAQKPTPLLQLEYQNPCEANADSESSQTTGHVPVAAAAAAAAVVATSVVAAVAKSSADSTMEIPVAAATAAAVIAIGRQKGDMRGEEDVDGVSYEPEASEHKESEGERTSDRSTGTESGTSDVALNDVAVCEIPLEEITMGERIGLGSYGEVYHGDWHGTEVAVKRFLNQDISGETLEEFRSEVHIMKRLRHPNVVLFMGAVTRPPNLSIITEFLPRGSLYRLIHRPNNQLDDRRRLRMAFDAARGMNYLHNSLPVIVHRDLKSPNLLVDRNWVVKVCDFGLSRMKHSTFLSSRTFAGTAEWMAPEVLRNEPSNEKCDVYSFGVILWELCTLQQPWAGMNPMQVVGAVGFQHRRLDIPDDVDPAIAEIIRKCWETDPILRPTFAEIMTALKPFQKPITAAQVGRSSALRSNVHDKAQQVNSGQETASI
ncbi:hypothetical protein V2J09_014847 [Rumex salicifolius]